LWRPPLGRRITALQWTPDGERFVVTTRGSPSMSRAELISANGATRFGVWRADSAAFFWDGTLALGRGAGVFVLRHRKLVLTASVRALARAAAQPTVRRGVWLGSGGYLQGYGQDRVAVSWSGKRRTKLLLVGADGGVKVVSPSRSSYELVGGAAWSQDGRSLLEFTVDHSPPGFPKDHDHCLDLWRPGARVTRRWCTSSAPKRDQFHFDKLMWSRSGKRGLLNDGTIVSREGAIVGHAAIGGDPAFAVQWRPR